jgi:hypothetical protein
VTTIFGDVGQRNNDIACLECLDFGSKAQLRLLIWIHCLLEIMLVDSRTQVWYSFQLVETPGREQNLLTPACH